MLLSLLSLCLLLLSSLLSSLLSKSTMSMLVDCPTRWSLWYWYMDFYVDHLYFDNQMTMNVLLEKLSIDEGGSAGCKVGENQRKGNNLWQRLILQRVKTFPHWGLQFLELTNFHQHCSYTFVFCCICQNLLYFCSKSALHVLLQGSMYQREIFHLFWPEEKKLQCRPTRSSIHHLVLHLQNCN